MDTLFGSLSAFAVTDSDGNFSGEHLGARVASLEFTRNVVRYGGYDAYHFMLGRGTHCDKEIEEYVKAHSLDPNKIRIYDGGLPLDRIKKTHYHVINKLDPFLNEGFDVRRVANHPLAPLTGMTHTISNAALMPVWTQLILGHVLFCDAIVCTSTAAREALERTFRLLSDRLSTRFETKVPTFRGILEIIPLGVDLEYWKPTGSKTQARIRLDLPEEPCIILCPARFSTHDKQDLRPLLLAVRRLLTTLGPDCFRIVLVGDDLRTKGGESGLIQGLVDKLGLTDVVKIDTKGDQPRIKEYYGAADIFVSLVDNVQETFGLTPVQAMACGLPAVVSDWDGYKDTVVHDETGFRIRTYWTECDRQISDLAFERPWLGDHLMLAQSVAIDIDEMVKCLHALVTNPDLRVRFGQAGRKRAEELYAWPVVIKQYRDLWDECSERFSFIDIQEWINEDRECVFSPSYYYRFSHYASSEISPATQLTLSSTSEEAISTPDPVKSMLLPMEMGISLVPEVFQAIGSRLSDGCIPFGVLVEAVCKEMKKPHHLVARHVMWMMKYGRIKPVFNNRHTGTSTVSAETVCAKQE